MSPEEEAFLKQVLPPKRDPITGLFPHNPANPRKQLKSRRYYAFNQVVAEYIEAHGGWVEDVLIDIFRSMFKAACEGDVAAAKLLLDRFCGKDADLLTVELTSSKLSDTERATRLKSILDAAADRVGRSRITVEEPKFPIRRN